MKRLLYCMLAVILAFSCSKYDDSWIKTEFSKRQNKINLIENSCMLLNTNVAALRDVLTALNEKDFIKSVSAIEEDGAIIGYELDFQKAGIVKLYYGKDGADGKDGVDAHKPLISVKQDTDGKWYWTIDGQWCVDEEGNKVPAISNDDVTPVFKIEDDCWFMSVDNGKTWENLGPAVGVHGDLMFSDVTYDDLYLYLTLEDGTVIKVPKVTDLGFTLGKVPSKIEPSSTFSVDYKITGGTGKAEISCIGEKGWTAKVVPATNMEGTVQVNAPEKLLAGKIVFFVSEGDITLMKALTFKGDKEESHFISSEYDLYEVDGTGGFVDVIVTTNQDYDIEIPENAKSWITYIKTKSVREDRVRLGIAANPSGMPSREAEITFAAPHGNISVLIRQKASPFIDSEVDMGPIDGFDDPENGIVILQQATKGSGTDIVIMGDGFSKRHFLEGGQYEAIMKQAYEAFFSVEPYASLKDYFNVYYINVLSAEDHDAVPYYDSYGNQNGAKQGHANTRLGTKFTEGSTSIEGNTSTVLQYATQAIEYKGSATGGKCSYSDASDRANKGLSIVVPNVKCYAGTCLLSWRSSSSIDYANLYSIAYCSLGSDGTGREFKYTLIHEAGGHGFGKLSDEYENGTLTRFNTSEWSKLQDYHNYGVYRNVNEYWTNEESLNWSGLDGWPYTTKENVYWSELLSSSYDYDETESLGMYKGAYTYSNMFCRPTPNSMMRNQLGTGGQFFNAISRWAIWYRAMRLTDSTTATDFKSSLNEFISFDRTLNISQNNAYANTGDGTNLVEDFRPLGTPVLIDSEWQGDEGITIIAR